MTEPMFTPTPGEFLLVATVTTIMLFIVLGLLDKHTSLLEPNQRRIAKTPVVILSAVVVIFGAADGPAGAMFALTFFVGIYAIGVIGNAFFPESAPN